VCVCASVRLSFSVYRTCGALDARCGFGGRYTGHTNTQYKLDCALSNDDAYVLSGSEDGRVCVWDLVSVRGSCLATCIGCTHVHMRALY
jgi:WD40 repeat protein